MYRKLFGNRKKKAFLYDNVVILPLYSTSQSILLKIGYMYDLLVGGVLFVFCCVLWLAVVFVGEYWWSSLSMSCYCFLLSCFFSAAARERF